MFVPMGEETVTKAEVRASATPDTIFVSEPLGAGLAVVMYDPVCKAGGMLSLLFPSTREYRQTPEFRPVLFADGGIPLLLGLLADIGCEPAHLRVALIGAGTPLDTSDTLCLGRRNLLAARRTLWRHDLAPVAEAVGGPASRTAILEVGTGRIIVRSRTGECVL